MLQPCSSEINDGLSLARQYGGRGMDAPIMQFCKRVHETCKHLPNVYTNMADINKMLMILTWFSVTITSRLVMAEAACNVS